MRDPRPTLPRFSCLRLALAALALVAITAPTRAQNLLANPEIAGSISPWTVCGGDTGSLGGNRTTCPDSDSLLAISSQVDCGLSLLVHELAFVQCVPLAGTGLVAGSSKAFFSAWLYFETDFAGVYRGIGLRYFTSEDCTGDEISHTSNGFEGGYAGWTFTNGFDLVTVPAGTASIEYRAIAFDLDNNTFFYSYFDTMPTWARGRASSTRDSSTLRTSPASGTRTRHESGERGEPDPNDGGTPGSRHGIRYSQQGPTSTADSPSRGGCVHAPSADVRRSSKREEMA